MTSHRSLIPPLLALSRRHTPNEQKKKQQGNRTRNRLAAQGRTTHVRGEKTTKKQSKRPGDNKRGNTLIPFRESKGATEVMFDLLPGRAEKKNNFRRSGEIKRSRNLPTHMYTQKKREGSRTLMSEGKPNVAANRTYVHLSRSSLLLPLPFSKRQCFPFVSCLVCVCVCLNAGVAVASPAAPHPCMSSTVSAATSALCCAGAGRGGSNTAAHSAALPGYQAAPQAAPPRRTARSAASAGTRCCPPLARAYVQRPPR